MEHHDSFIKPHNAVYPVVCQCCRRVINQQSANNCPYCGYPLNLAQEKRLLEDLQQVLQRIAQHGGESLRIGGLVDLTSPALQAIQRIAIYKGPQIPVSQLIAMYDLRLQELARMSEAQGAQLQNSAIVESRKSFTPHSQLPMRPPRPWLAQQRASDTFTPHSQLPTRPLLPWTVPQPIPDTLTPNTQPPQPLPPPRSNRPNPVAALRPLIDSPAGLMIALGTFLILIAMLGLSFSYPGPAIAVTAGAQVFFAVMAIFTRRSNNFREFSRLYSVFFALTIPLIAIDIQQQHLPALPTTFLISIAALYASITYGAFAIYQRFSPFGYLSITALLIAVGSFLLSFPNSSVLQWAASLYLLLAMAGLFALPGNPKRTSQLDLLFDSSWAVLRSPARLYMYIIVFVVAIAYVTAACIFILEDLIGITLLLFGIHATRSVSLTITLLLLLAWLCLYMRRVRAYNRGPIVAGLFLLCVLTFVLMLGLQQKGYGLAMIGVAILYHLIRRVVQKRLDSLPGSTSYLDVFAVILVSISSLIIAPIVSLQAFMLLVTQNGALFTLTSPPSALIAILTLLAGAMLTVSVATSSYRASLSDLAYAPGKPVQTHTDRRPWLLLLSGFMLNWAYCIMVLVLNIDPVLSFFGLTLVTVAGTVLVRRFLGSAWSNPLDVLSLFEIAFTLILSLNLNQDVISILLLAFATLLYVVLLYQKRQSWLFLPLVLALLALPTLWGRPLALLLMSALLPLASVAIHRLITNKWRVSDATSQSNQLLANMWEWPLLVAGFVYGIVISAHDVVFSTSVLEKVLGIGFPVALELVLLSLTWYASAALARIKLWLIPTVVFAVGALLIPTTPFWVFICLTPVLALSGVSISRFSGRDWALPLFIAAVISSVMTGYTGFTQDYLVETTWALLGFAALAYIVGVFEKAPVSMWIMPVFATLSMIIAASFLGDLFRPPTVALVCVAAGISISFLSHFRVPLSDAVQKNTFLPFALPFYVTAFAAAVLTGIYGTLAYINPPFYGTIPDVMLAYAVIVFAVLIFEGGYKWLWLVAGFAIWGISLVLELSAIYMLGAGIAMAVIGLLAGRMIKQPATGTSAQTNLHTLRKFTWSWPWYITACIAAILTGAWTSLPVDQPVVSSIVYNLLEFTAISLLIMLVERVPEVLIFSTGLAAWAIWLWQPPLVPMMIVYSLLFLLIFTTQFIWKPVPPVSHWLPASRLHVIVGIGGQVLVVLVIIAHGGLSANSGQLAHVGAAALLELAMLLFWYGFLQRVRAVQHWCYYIAGLLLSFVISWELSAFGQTRFDVLMMVPASYLTVIVPFLMRDRYIPNGKRLGEIIAVIGAAGLLVPSLLLSLGSDQPLFGNFPGNLFSMLLLLVESLCLYALGYVVHVRTFILSGASLVVVVAILAFRYAITPGNPQQYTTSVWIILAVSGIALLFVALTLMMRRRESSRSNSMADS